MLMPAVVGPLGRVPLGRHPRAQLGAACHVHHHCSAQRTPLTAPYCCLRHDRVSAPTALSSLSPRELLLCLLGGSVVRVALGAPVCRRLAASLQRLRTFRCVGGTCSRVAPSPCLCPRDPGPTVALGCLHMVVTVAGMAPRAAGQAQGCTTFRWGATKVPTVVKRMCSNEWLQKRGHDDRGPLSATHTFAHHAHDMYPAASSSLSTR